MEPNEVAKIVAPRGGEVVQKTTPTGGDPTNKPGNTTVVPPNTNTNTGGENPVNVNTLPEVKVDELDKHTKSILTEKFDDLKGVFVKDGNYVNEKGEVVYSKEDVQNKITEINTLYDEAISKVLTPEQELVVVIDEKEVTGVINDKGELLNEAGEVVLDANKLKNYLKDNYSVDEINSFTEVEEPIINQLSKLSGYEVYDEQGNKVEFEDSVQGLAKREAYLINQEATRLANDKLNTFLDQYPDLEDVINYVTINKSLEGYNPNKSYNGVTIDPENSSQNMQLVIEAEVLRGRTEAEAKKLASVFRDNNLLPDMAKTSLAYLKSNREKIIADRRQEVENLRIKEEQERVDNINNINKIVQSGKLLDFNVPENIKVKDSNGVYRTVPKQAFIDFVTKPVKDNLTADQLLQSQETLENRLFISYLRFTGLDIKNLVNAMANSKLVESYKAKKNKLRLPNTIKPTVDTSNKPVSPIRR